MLCSRYALDIQTNIFRELCANFGELCCCIYRPIYVYAMCPRAAHVGMLWLKHICSSKYNNGGYIQGSTYLWNNIYWFGVVISLMLWLAACMQSAYKVVQHTDSSKNIQLYNTSLQVSLLLIINLWNDHANFILSSCHYSVETQRNRCRIQHVPPTDLGSQIGVWHAQR